MKSAAVALRAYQHGARHTAEVTFQTEVNGPDELSGTRSEDLHEVICDARHENMALRDAPF
jgi:hypothetical protein